ncbi:MAG TPA: Gfo/Idh/MocA family oxidoreductase [Flavitalea sp.]|nr:Gfo/Idh/MocA family oxidoreductase [Flavitalea sp.]
MKKQSRSRRDFLKMMPVPGLTLALSPGLVPFERRNPPPKGRRVGIIGLDTSHSTEFTKLLNDANASDAYHGYQVTCAYPQGSPGIWRNATNIPKFTDLIKPMGVKIVDSIDELLNQVDAVLLETNDGAIHLEQAMPAFKARKPIFIDKPMGVSLADVLQQFEAAEKHQAPMFSSSSLRFVDGVQAVANGLAGKVLGADTFSPAYIEKTHPILFWYGIHGVETLLTVMGPGCEAVSCTHTEDSDIAVGRWSDGRLGTMRGTRTGRYGIGGTVYGDKENMVLDVSGGYKNLVLRIADFFKTGIPPVRKDQTIEVYAFMQAAEESIKQGGAYISIAEIMKKAAEANRGK